MSDAAFVDGGYSSRRSSRVDQMAGIAPDQRIFLAAKAPESIAASSSSPAARPATPSERRGGPAAEFFAPARRLTAAQLVAVRDGLSSRDQLVLASLDQHPYLITAQLQRLHFASHATDGAAGRVCRRVLKRLAGLRIIEHLDRRVGGVRAGSASYVWRIGPVGDRLLRLTHNEGGRLRRKEPSLRYLEHCLLAAETHIRLLEAGQRGELEVIRVEAEPTCWRSYLGPGAARGVLKPDLYAVTAAPGGAYEDHWFIEVDRATESIPTLLGKCVQYEQYRRAGVEQQAQGVFPRVLWLLPSQQRRQGLAEALGRARTLDRNLHRLTTINELIPAVLEADR
ncbi:replication-relaxation family protein [uncultured Friedmanniella sp.]|uniref:replication-relaxation family protein n=1 Tax=uncultured Friedmanniella sp. TaxID=335381 RepID=UPI0035C9A9F7